MIPAILEKWTNAMIIEAMSGRPVFGPVDRHGVSTVKLPAGTTLEDAAAGLATMLKSYRPGLYVYEETWMSRTGRVNPDAGDLTNAETKAILSGDPAPVQTIKVRRFLWRVVKLEHGGSVWLKGEGSQMVFTAPHTVILTRCDKPNDLHMMSLDEAGVRFSQPHQLDGPPHLVAAFTSTYNKRLDAAVPSAERKRADRDWRLLWLQLLFSTAVADPLRWWTAPRRTDVVALLTWTSASSMSALTWWANSTAEWTVVEDGEDALCDDVDPHAVTRDLKAPVPRSSAMALQTWLASSKNKANKAAACPARPTPLARHQQTFQGAINPFELYRVGAGGQGIELATLSSYLGSSAHLAASYRLLRAKPDLPTALLPVNGAWDALGRYVATLPPIALMLGRALANDLANIAAVEFPMVWCGLGEDNTRIPRHRLKGGVHTCKTCHNQKSSSSSSSQKRVPQRSLGKFECERSYW